MRLSLRISAALAALVSVGAHVTACGPSETEQSGEATDKADRESQPVNGSQALSLTAKYDRYGRTLISACPDPAPGSARCASSLSVGPPNQGVAVPGDTQGGSTGWGASDLAGAYDIPTTIPANATVGIVTANYDPNEESDLGVYRAAYALPSCTISNGCLTIANAQGSTNPSNFPQTSAHDAIEASLDVDMASAACPSCKIVVVLAGNSPSFGNLYSAAAEAVSLGASVVSVSYYISEVQNGVDYGNLSFSVGVPVFSCSGDYGYDGNNPALPAVLTSVTGVGGTVLNQVSQAVSPRLWQETAWNSAGSGCSPSIARPAWQANASSACANRAMADVSAVAENVLFYDTFGGFGGWGTVNGTSIGSPLVAAIYAQTRNVGSAIGPSYSYANSNKFFDVTSGSNGSCGGNAICTAGTGYDGPTGTGTPNAYEIQGEYLTLSEPAGTKFISFPANDSFSDNSSQNVFGVRTNGSWSTDPTKLSLTVSALPPGITYEVLTSVASGGQVVGGVKFAGSSTTPVTTSPQRVLITATSAQTNPASVYAVSGYINVTACQPLTSCVGYCGSVPDGCGGTLSCTGNSCEDGYTCKNSKCTPIPNYCQCGGIYPKCKTCNVEPVADGGGLH